MELFTKSAKETKELGRKMAADLITGSQSSSKIIALVGDLGSGKTTFVQGFARGLGIKAQITSPTFILMRNYDIPSSPETHHLITGFYHLDLYRLEQNVENEVKNLGITDIWKDPRNIIIIEWAEKIKNIIPKNAIWIEFEYKNEQERVIKT